MSIAHKTAKGAIWLSSSKLLQQFSSFIVIIVLSRLLAPADFGLVAMINVYIAFVMVFTNVGLGSSIINKTEITQKQLSTIYWLNQTLGLFSFVVIVLSTPLAVNYFNEPKLQKLIWILALNSLIMPFFLIHRRLLEKNIDFSTLGRIDILAVPLASFIGILSAYLGCGVYSLIFQSLSLNLFYLFFIRKSCTWKPDLVFSPREVWDMVRFSIKYKGAITLNYFERNIDYLILGKVFDSTTLGYYSFAYNIMFFPVKRISFIFSTILFPVFSSVKESKEKVLKGYLMSLQLIAQISFPLMLFISLFSSQLIGTFFGNKWLPAAQLISIIAGAGAIQSIDQLSNALLPAMDKENVFVYLGATRLVIMALAIFSAIKFGLLGVAYAILIAKFIDFVINITLLKICVHLKIREIINYLYPPLTSCLSILLFYYFFLKNIFIINELFTTITNIFFLSFLYISLLFAMNGKNIIYCFNLIRNKS